MCIGFSETGHWYCSQCNDVVNMRRPAPDERKSGEICIVCHNRSADWIGDNPVKEITESRPIRSRPSPAKVTPENARKNFLKIRQSIDLENPS